MPRIAAALAVFLTVVTCIGFNTARYPAVWEMIAGPDRPSQSHASEEPTAADRSSGVSQSAAVPQLAFRPESARVAEAEPRAKSTKASSSSWKVDPEIADSSAGGLRVSNSAIGAAWHADRGAARLAGREPAIPSRPDQHVAGTTPPESARTSLVPVRTTGASPKNPRDAGADSGTRAGTRSGTGAGTHSATGAGTHSATGASGSLSATVRLAGAGKPPLAPACCSDSPKLNNESGADGREAGHQIRAVRTDAEPEHARPAGPALLVKYASAVREAAPEADNRRAQPTQSGGSEAQAWERPLVAVNSRKAKHRMGEVLEPKTSQGAARVGDDRARKPVVEPLPPVDWVWDLPRARGEPPGAGTAIPIYPTTSVDGLPAPSGTQREGQP